MKLYSIWYGARHVGESSTCLATLSMYTARQTLGMSATVTAQSAPTDIAAAVRVLICLRMVTGEREIFWANGDSGNYRGHGRE